MRSRRRRGARRRKWRELDLLKLGTTLRNHQRIDLVLSNLDTRPKFETIRQQRLDHQSGLVDLSLPIELIDGFDIVGRCLRLDVKKLGVHPAWPANKLLI